MAFYLENTNKIVAGNAEVMTDSSQMFVVQGFTIGSSIGWDGVDAGSKCSFQVMGTIMSVGGNALYLTGSTNHISVGPTGALMGALNLGAALRMVSSSDLTNAGTIAGYDGVDVSGTGNKIANSGTISGSSVGIDVSGTDNHIANDGNISGIKWAIFFDSNSGNSVFNSGTISTTGNQGIWFGNTDGNGFAAVYNSGTIEAPNGAVVFAGPGGYVENSGHIVGDVSFETGVGSTYDGGQGTIAGEVFGGAGDDIITTGAGRDHMAGFEGADLLEGGAGRDMFEYRGAVDSTGAAYDTIVDFDFRHDLIQLDNDSVLDIDVAVVGGRLRGDHFNSDLAAAVNGQHLAVAHAVLFIPDSGSLKGEVILVIDTNHKAGYQSGKDMVIDLHNPDNIDNFNLGDIITFH